MIGPENTIAENANGTQTGYRRQVITMIIAAVLVTAGVLCVVFFWFKINTGAREALREAKDIRIAMKMKAIECYGLGGSVYSPASKNGIKDSMAEDILRMADAEGTIILQSWDSKADEPLAFTYQKDDYIVVFQETGDGGLSWKAYYTLELIKYE